VSTESLYQQKTGVALRAPAHPLPAEVPSTRLRSLLAPLDVELPGSRLKKALLAATLAAAALYYVSVVVIAVAF